MQINSVTEELFHNFLSISWLRPEGVTWDTVAAVLLQEWINSDDEKLDFGSGNGYTTFITSRGKFADTYDWYHNTNVEGFKENSDIYNVNKLSNIKDFIAKSPEVKWSLAIDHKSELLKQASQLDLYSSTFVANGNNPLPLEIGKFDLIFSNILYWLNDPFLAIQNLIKHLNENGKIIVAFPNNNFYRFAQSYNWKKENSNLLKLLNRGRADSILWSMDYSDFKSKLKLDKLPLEIIEFKSFLSESLIKLWDVGLRPLSPALISHVNRITSEERLRFKIDWCNSIKDILLEQLKEEIGSVGNNKGGFNFIVMKLS